MTQLWYVAHPVAPPCACRGGSHGRRQATMPQSGSVLASQEQIDLAMVDCNCDRARLWLRWLLDAAPNVALVASWLPYLDVVPDGDPAWRKRGMRDNLAVVRQCHGIILVGGRVSTGMAAERDALFQVTERPDWQCDLTYLGTHPPTVMPASLPYPLGA